MESKGGGGCSHFIGLSTLPIRKVLKEDRSGERILHCHRRVRETPEVPWRLAGIGGGQQLAVIPFRGVLSGGGHTNIIFIIALQAISRILLLTSQHCQYFLCFSLLYYLECCRGIVIGV